MPKSSVGKFIKLYSAYFIVYFRMLLKVGLSGLTIVYSCFQNHVYYDAYNDIFSWFGFSLLRLAYTILKVQVVESFHGITGDMKLVPNGKGRWFVFVLLV